MKKINIARSEHQAMLDQLAAALPFEACGLMAGNGNEVHHLYPVENQLLSPYAYRMEPNQQLEAMLDLEEKGWQLLAIYHSHPQGPDAPSMADVAQAYYPEAVYVIVSFSDRQHPSIRAFNIVDEQVVEIPYIIR